LGEGGSGDALARRGGQCKRPLCKKLTRRPPSQNRVRAAGGIPPLVALLEAWDIKVQRAGAGALRTLAFKNDENKRQIVERGALPLLIQVGGGGRRGLGLLRCRDGGWPRTRPRA
jgi:hypothetical protein